MKTSHTSLSDDESQAINPVSQPADPRTTDIVSPPDGESTTGDSGWWRWCFSQSERERLDHLVGLALLDAEICERLVNKRDPSLFSIHGLSRQTQDWLKIVPAKTLKELAQLIVEVTKTGERVSLHPGKR